MNDIEPDEKQVARDLLTLLHGQLTDRQRQRIARELQRQRDAFVGHEGAPLWLPHKKAQITLWNTLCERYPHPRPV